MNLKKAGNLLSKAKLVTSINYLLLLGSGVLLLVFFAVRSTTPPAAPSRGDGVLVTAGDIERRSSSYSCSKIAPSLAHAIIHYTTTNVTPQQTAAEIGVTARVLERRSPCNFLVFGLGRDSLMWAALNHGGRTVFLEEDAGWIASIREQQPSLESYHVAYPTTRVADADRLLKVALETECTAPVDELLAAGDGGDIRSSECVLALKTLPEVFYEVQWDLIMVDAPTGWRPEAPGRMGAIYTAGMAARLRKDGGETDVFVHDVDRFVEDKFSKALLCEGYLKEQEGRLRHFTIPSHRPKPPGTPFCP